MSLGFISTNASRTTNRAVFLATRRSALHTRASAILAPWPSGFVRTTRDVCGGDVRESVY
ncbi:MAG TPA: hypothetical protein VH539_23315 [Gemmatimonadaceae bacterium]